MHMETLLAAGILFSAVGFLATAFFGYLTWHWQIQTVLEIRRAFKNLTGRELKSIPVEKSDRAAETTKETVKAKAEPKAAKTAPRAPVAEEPAEEEPKPELSPQEVYEQAAKCEPPLSAEDDKTLRDKLEAMFGVTLKPYKPSGNHNGNGHTKPADSEEEIPESVRKILEKADKEVAGARQKATRRKRKTPTKRTPSIP